MTLCARSRLSYVLYYCYIRGLLQKDQEQGVYP